jgi:uncharacterized iron-regulated membrane protein
MSGTGEVRARPAYYGLFWRWHFFAALIVVPFVLWQATTGTLYLWSEWAMDTLHPALRFVVPADAPKPPSEQVAAALAFAAERPSAPMTSMHMHGMSMPMTMPMGPKTATPHGPAVLGILLPAERNRSTTVLLQDTHGLAYPVFVDPGSARVLGSLSSAAWLPGLSRSLHGGWPLGKPGSWLLELGDCWAIVMILTGFYLWWPRGRRLPEFLVPRFGSGTRVMLRDLHATVAVLFSAVFLFFLISALPWTQFWGNELLSRVEAVTGQQSAAPFSSGGAAASQVSSALTGLDQAVRETRARGVNGTLDIRLSPRADAPWWLTNVHTVDADHTLTAGAADGAVTADVTNDKLPAIPRFVAFGVHVHQGDFGLWNLWLNTFFALSLIWLSATGIASWWMRRPKGKIAPPPKTETRWPVALASAAVVMSLVLPLFGLSVVLLAAGERAVRMFVRTA